jgi:hypothetical protein
MNYTSLEQSPQPSSGFFLGYGLFWLIFAVAVIAGLWKTFQKAKRPGWAAIIPFYNLYIMIKIAGKPGWWLLLYFIPIVSLIIHIIVSINFAKAFGRSTAFGLILIWLFLPIGALMLGFGKTKFVGSPK